MIQTGHIGKREAVAMVTMYLSASLFLGLPQDITDGGQTAAWMIPLGSALIAVFFFWLLDFGMRHARSRTMVELVEDNLGPWIGMIMGLLLGTFFVVDTAMDMRQFSETVITTVLPNTPLSVAVFVFAAATVYLAYYGLEMIGRFSKVVWVGLGISFFSLIFLAWNWFHLDFLFPLWGPGIPAVIRQCGMKSSYFSEILVLGLLYPALRRKRDFRHVGYASILIAGVLMTVLVGSFTLTFTIESAQRNPFPLYQIARLVYLGRHVQRVEALFIFLWVISVVIKIAVGIWAATQFYARGFRMPVYRPLVFPVAALIDAVNYLPRNFPEALHYSNDYLHSYGWVLLLTLPVLMIAGNWRVARREGNP
jgi:spore germination protein KB